MFVSKDAFSGFLDDPMGQHDYQYGHANPVVNTDPTGYFTLGDVLNTITTASQLALIGNTSFSVLYITAGIISGANAGDVLQMFSDLVHNACGDDIIQSGGRTLRNSTAKALNEFSGEDLNPGEWGKKQEKLKESLGQGSSFHSHEITRSGDVYVTEDFGDFQAGDWIGNLTAVPAVMMSK